MRQISLRQEAGRLGGIGSCGRELCCSTWLTEFKSVTTTAARYQNLSLNPSKLSGQCGRLKCCLNYELDTYMDALKDIPELNKPLLTQKGEARLQKTDIFKKIMWFGYESENSWISIPISRVKEIIKLNEEGAKPATLKEDNIAPKDEVSEALNSDLELLDKKFQNKTNKKKKRRKNHRNHKNRNKNPNQ
jgi:cell fate regulator YaaT (PSP1 superfamily)